MSRSAVGIRVLFAATLCVFVVQTSMAIKIREPYPALILPPFSGTHQFTGGIIELKEPLVVVNFADGTSENLEYQRFLSPAPIAPIAIFKSITREPMGPETVEWIHARTSALFPGKSATSVDFVWRTAAYDASVERRPPAYKVDKTVHVAFQEPL